MISEKMKRFIEQVNHVYIASADQRARPHLAAASGLKVPDPRHLIFDSWFCHQTLENIAEVPRLALVVVDPASGAGYQFLGRVESTSDIAFLNGFAPEFEEPGLPQVETRIVVRIEEILEFSRGPHTDHAIAAES